MRDLVAVIFVAALSTGCHHSSCASFAAPSGLTSTELLIVSAYRSPTTCVGQQISPATAKPFATHSGPANAPLSFDVGAGDVWVQVLVYADEAGTQLLDEACSHTIVKSNHDTCLELQLAPPAEPDGGMCTPLQHMNGVGQTYEDCAALGTFEPQQAEEACTAFTGNGSDCNSQNCGGGGNSTAICSDGASKCLCWTYSGAGAGHVGGVGDGGGGCTCGTTSDPTTWN